MSPRSLVSALDFLTRARGAQHARCRQKPRGRGTKAAATLGGERLEPRLALAVNPATGLPADFPSAEELAAEAQGIKFASGLPADMTASAYLFVGDHSVSNSEIWRMNVADKPLTAPSWGDVRREQATFARGVSYPIKVDWRHSNRAGGPDYDYRAWIDRSANPTWTSGSPTPSSPDFFVTDPGQLLQRRWFGSEVDATLDKTAEVHFPGIDLDVDSDNSGSVDGSPAEDALELVTTTGVNVPVSTASMAGLTPLVLGMSDNLRRAATTAEVSFTFSTTAPTAFRLWRDAARTLPLPWGTAVTAAQLGLAFGGRLNLQLEAVTQTSSFAAITTTALVTGGIWQGTLQDTVRARGVPGVDLDVDSDNTGSISRSILEDSIEDDPTRPGVLVPVGPQRTPIIVDVPAGRTASLAITQGADKVRLWTAPTDGTAIPAAGSTVVGGSPQTFWIEAFAPSESMADIAFTLTLDVSTGSGSTGSAPSDTIRATAVEVDLDVDSDNNDRLNSPKRDLEEEDQEATTPKRIVVNDNDTDGDHVPDYADWSIADKRFTPLVLEIPAGLPLGMMQIHVSYAASDPTSVGADHGLPANSSTRPLRIWTKNASQQRNPASITAGGSFVPEGRVEALTTLGFTESIRTVELYVEGIRATAGVSKPISAQLIVGDRVSSIDLVNVVVVSNTLVIGIDGTDSAEWLAKKDAKGNLINERTMPDGSTRWNSHVRNLVTDCEPFAMTYYTAGPDQNGPLDDSAVVFERARDAARALTQDAGGGTTIALVGWSRGAMIASGVAHALLTLADGDLPRTVAFIGMYDPVDMSNGIPPAWATIHAHVQAVTIVGPTADRQTEDAFNVDYPVSGYRGVDNWTFERMALENRITTAQGAAAVPQRKFYNASHGALGGTPGYNKRHRDGGEFPENYDYGLDVQNSILADKDIRAGMRAAGLKFVPDRDAAWYGFPDDRPPKEHRE
jgi:hypothetical protein